MSDADPQVTALLARFVLETKIEAIPENVRREGIRSLVNIIGCALGGSRHDAVNKAWAALQPFAGGEQVTLIGRSQRTDALTAAFINTLSCSINAFDDTHAEAIVHPSGPVMAAVLAVTEMQPVTGAEALAAFMLGIEAVCRLSKAISVAPANGDIAWSQTGVTCGIGAALAAARLMRLDLGTARMAAGIAAAGASGIRALHGSMCTAALPAFCQPVGVAGCTAGKRRLYGHAVGDRGALWLRPVLCTDPTPCLSDRRARHALGDPRQHLQAISMWHRHPPDDRGHTRDRPGAQYRGRGSGPRRDHRQPGRHGALLPPTPEGRDGGACQPLPLGGSGSRAGQGRHPRGHRSSHHRSCDPDLA